jgi:hypothetical protein
MQGNMTELLQRCCDKLASLKGSSDAETLQGIEESTEKLVNLLRNMYGHGQQSQQHHDWKGGWQLQHLQCKADA